ncbi:MAG: hypothetical protein ABJB69_01540 [Spartobacteria bacterium]
MANSSTKLSFATAALLGVLSISQAQNESPAPASSPVAAASIAPTLPSTPVSPASAKTADSSPLLLVQASASGAAPSPGATTTATSTSKTTTTTTGTAPTETDSAIESGGVGVREFQGDDVGQVLRLLARQAKINMVVSEAVVGTVTMRLEDVTAMQSVAIIVKAKGLFMDKIDNVYYIKTAQERTAEPTESDSYQFSYSRAKDTAPLIASQLASHDPPQVDERTNTIFFRETRSNIDNVRKLLVQIDKPTKQVMIEARLVEVTSNPKQSYGINWAGVVGSSTNAQTVSYGGYNDTLAKPGQNIPTNGLALGDKTNGNFFGGLGGLAGVAQSGFAILSVPQFSATLRMLNEDRRCGIPGQSTCRNGRQSTGQDRDHAQPTSPAAEL